MGESGARAVIASAGLSVSTVSTANSDTVSTGLVMSQEPAAGMIVGGWTEEATSVSVAGRRKPPPCSCGQYGQPRGFAGTGQWHAASA
jgi:serine/threonine-protein kinase